MHAIARGPKPPLEEALVYNDGEQRADPVDERVARDARLAARRGLHAGVHRIRVHSGRVAPHRRRPRAQHVHQRCGRLIRARPRAFKKDGAYYFIVMVNLVLNVYYEQYRIHWQNRINQLIE